ncbi:hypothetical protein C6T60_24455 [Burkholderia multivorans]|nr:hypothetical protein C6T60_24455 [Burkholderia multivorans]
MSRRPRHTAAFMLRAELDAGVLMLLSPWGVCRRAAMRGTVARCAIARRTACRNGASVLRVACERGAGQAMGGAPSCAAAPAKAPCECADAWCCTCASGGG